MDMPTEVTLVRLHWQNQDHMLAVMRDLRETYRLTEVEKAVRQRLKVMLDSSPLACTIYDERFNVLDVNKEVVSLFEVRDKQEYIDRSAEFSPIYQPDGRLSAEKMYDAMKTALDTGKYKLGWMYTTSCGNHLPSELVLERVIADGETLIISYIRDLRAINNALSLVDHLERLAYTDPLTGAFNRRYFMEEAEQKLRQNIDDNQPFSIIMADLDFFKSINDTYGHDVGDEVLKIFVERMGHVTRNVTIARFGGEEFVVLLPATSIENAAEVAWRIQKNIESSNFVVFDADSRKDIAIRVTASFGVACRTNEAYSISAILINADKALYQAKASGRNSVIAI